MQASATDLSSLVFKLPVNAAATASLRCAKAQDVLKKGRAPGLVWKGPIHFRQLWPGALTSSSFLLKPEASQNRAVLLFPA